MKKGKSLLECLPIALDTPEFNFLTDLIKESIMKGRLSSKTLWDKGDRTQDYADAKKCSCTSRLWRRAMPWSTWWIGIRFLKPLLAESNRVIWSTMMGWTWSCTLWIELQMYTPITLGTSLLNTATKKWRLSCLKMWLMQFLRKPDFDWNHPRFAKCSERIGATATRKGHRGW